MPRRAPLCLLLLCLGSAVQAADPLPVEIVTATAVPPLRSYALTGEIAARDEIAAAFPVAGRLIEVVAREGDRVAAGDILARLDPVQQQQALRSAEAGLASAQADQARRRAISPGWMRCSNAGPPPAPNAMPPKTASRPPPGRLRGRRRSWNRRKRRCATPR